MTEKKTPKGVPVFHADHGLVDEHFVLIDEILTRESGFFINVYDMPGNCPDLQSALYGPAAGDPPVTEDQVKYEKRGARPGPSRLVTRPHRACRKIVVCGIADGGDSRVFTAYGTQAAMPSPREWWDASMKPSEAVEAASFWAEHALAE